MPTRTEIIEAGARALNSAGWTCAGGLHEPGYFDICKECRKVAAEVTEPALAAMLPLIKAQLAVEVRDGSQIIHTSEGVPFRMNEPAALIVEGYEL